MSENSIDIAIDEIKELTGNTERVENGLYFETIVHDDCLEMLSALLKISDEKLKIRK